MEDINVPTQKIRDLINEPRKQYLLLKNKPLWFQLCSSLDAIEDAELAINSYGIISQNADDGIRYLAIYGFLQALFLQQYASIHLCEALGGSIDLNHYPVLKEIRDIRNASIGHPTKKGRKNNHSFHIISRVTLGPNGFQLITHYQDGTYKIDDVIVPDLINKQQSELAGILGNLLEQLEDERRKHKETFKLERLADVFAVLNYHFEKINEGCNDYSDHRATLAHIDLQYVKEAVTRFRSLLEKRDIGLEAYPGIKYCYDEIEFTISELEAFFEGGQSTVRLNGKAAYIFASYLEKQVTKLRVMAEELDNEYST